MEPYKSPRRCPKCLQPMRANQFRDRDTCDPACIRGLMEYGQGGESVGHLHWVCAQCGFMEATLPADASGYDRWKQ